MLHRAQEGVEEGQGAAAPVRRAQECGEAGRNQAGGAGPQWM